jgi:hypothetical protein
MGTDEEHRAEKTFAEAVNAQDALALLEEVGHGCHRRQHARRYKWPDSCHVGARQSAVHAYRRDLRLARPPLRSAAGVTALQ